MTPPRLTRRRNADAPAFQLEGIHVRRGRRDILRDVALELEDGGTLAVIGPNGDLSKGIAGYCELATHD